MQMEVDNKKVNDKNMMGKKLKSPITGGTEARKEESDIEIATNSSTDRQREQTN